MQITHTQKEYQDFFFHSDVLLLADVFENFPNMCLGIYELTLLVFLLHLD